MSEEFKQEFEPEGDCPPTEDCGNMFCHWDYCILADWVRKTLELCFTLFPEQLDFLTEKDNLHFDLLQLLRIRERLYRCADLTHPKEEN